MLSDHILYSNDFGANALMLEREIWRWSLLERRALRVKGQKRVSGLNHVTPVDFFRRRRANIQLDWIMIKTNQPINAWEIAASDARVQTLWVHITCFTKELLIVLNWDELAGRNYLALFTKDLALKYLLFTCFSNRGISAFIIGAAWTCDRRNRIIR